MASVVVLSGKDIINHFYLFSVTLVLNPIRWQGYPGKEGKKEKNKPVLQNWLRTKLETASPCWHLLLFNPSVCTDYN